ncbi:MAG: hypothetical protein HY882_08720 [Deltaproteobacteria bacterium]|nr:hypothetical protein [Deltaproteobacteria bacterium]
MKKIRIAGLRQVTNLSQVEVPSLPMGLSQMAQILILLAENGINLEFVVTHAHADDTIDLVFGVQRNHIAAALGLLRGMREKFGWEEVRSRDGVGMISLFPHGSRAAVIGNFLSAFKDAGIRLLTISFSLSAISGLIEERLIPDALNALSEYFELPG